MCLGESFLYFVYLYFLTCFQTILTGVTVFVFVPTRHGKGITVWYDDTCQSLRIHDSAVVRKDWRTVV